MTSDVGPCSSWRTEHNQECENCLTAGEAVRCVYACVRPAPAPVQHTGGEGQDEHHLNGLTLRQET